jgi:Protein of unknown function (DUF1554)
MTNMTKNWSAAVLCVLVAGCGANESVIPSNPSGPTTFFVTSSRSTTGNLGGLSGADALCQRLAATVSAGGHEWRAYLSANHDPANGDKRVDARSRIGIGPWRNANGVLVARNLEELHSRTGDASLLIDETGRRINGQWPGSPAPVEHDILTGSNADGTLIPDKTCNDWTSQSSAISARVGHSDGLGPGGSAAGALSSWNSSHDNESCANTAPRGGAGRLYCFARN